MKFYKLFRYNEEKQIQEFIGIATSEDFCNYKPHIRMVTKCLDRDAEYINCNGVLYNTDVMHEPVTDIYDYSECSMEMISEQEYVSLSEAIELGTDIKFEEIEESQEFVDEIEEPISELQMYKQTDLIRDRLDHIEQALIELASLLTEGE